MMQIRALGLDDLLSLLALYGQLHPQDSVRPSGAVARAAFAHRGSRTTAALWTGNWWPAATWP